MSELVELSSDEAPPEEEDRVSIISSADDEAPVSSSSSSSSAASSDKEDDNETASVAPLSEEEKAVEDDEESSDKPKSSSTKAKKSSKKGSEAPKKKRKSGAAPRKGPRKKSVPKNLTPNPSVQEDVEMFLAARSRDGKREFLVKHKHTSYWRVTWLPEEVILEMSPHNRMRVQRWVEKTGEPDTRNNDADTEFFNPNYRVIDRIVAMRSKWREFLIKWRDLNYNDCTWEKSGFLEGLDGWSDALAKFKKRSEVPAPVKQPKQLRFDPKMEAPLFLEGRTLRPYQLEGFRWLVYSWIKGNKGILADEMGLGKTIQSISILQWLTSVGHTGPFVVVAPLSTLGQWQREIEGWSDLNAVIYHGDAHTREVIHEYEWSYPNSPQVKFDVLVTSYEMLLQEVSRLSKVTWKYMILDEGHRIKNTQAKVLVALEKFAANHKLILTGTPLQNNMSELWSMLNFLEPEKFSNRPDFLALFGDLQDAAQLAKLQDQLAPHFLRRLKEDVEKDLPVKEEIIIMVELNSIQKAFYKAVLERNGEFLRRGSGVRAKLLNIFMELRKVCNHPFLLTGAETQLTEGKSKETAAELLVTASSKMIFLDKLLRKLKEDGHKVLIFSQMTKQLDIIEDYLASRSYDYERLDGSHSQAQREHSLRQFRKGSTFAFLLSTRAGGVGLNLTTADTVVIFDSDWNPQNDLQAQARCHRIGQTAEVKIYRLLTSDSYEKHMFDVASKKLGLATAVLGKREATEVAGEGDAAKAELDANELNQLLRFGAYQLFNTDVNAESAQDKKIMDESLDSILARASRVTYLDAGAADGPKVSFAKAAFDEVAAEVKMDDEAFWEKILPEFKSTRRFLAKLDNAVEMKEEEKEQLLAAIPDLVAEVRKTSRDRNFWASFDPMQDLAQLLAQVITSSAFTDAQRTLAQQYQEDLLSSGRRHGRLAPSKMYGVEGGVPAAANGGGHSRADAVMVDQSSPVEGGGRRGDHEFDDDDSGDEEVRGKRKRAPNGAGAEKKRERQERKEAKEKLWLTKTKATFKQMMLVYGWGRWERIVEAGELKKSPQSVRAFAEAWLCGVGFESELFSVLRESKRDVLEHAVAMDAPEGPIDAEIELTLPNGSAPMQPDDQFVLKVTSPASATPTILEKPLAAVLFFVMPGEKGEAVPVRLIAVPALNQAVPVGAPGFMGNYVARLVAGKKTYSYSDNDAPFTVARLLSLANEAPPKHGQLHRLKTMRLVNRLAAIYGPEFRGLPSEAIVPRGPTPTYWWADEFDRRLLATVYARGVRFWEVHLDPTSGLDDAAIEKYLTNLGQRIPDRIPVPPLLPNEPPRPPPRHLPLSNKLALRLERVLSGLDYFHSTIKKRESAPSSASAAPAATSSQFMSYKAPAPSDAAPTVKHTAPAAAMLSHAHASASASAIERKDAHSRDTPESPNAKKAKTTSPNVKTVPSPSASPSKPPQTSNATPAASASAQPKSLISQLAEKVLNGAPAPASSVPMKAAAVPVHQFVPTAVSISASAPAKKSSAVSAPAAAAPPPVPGLNSKSQVLLNVQPGVPVHVAKPTPVVELSDSDDERKRQKPKNQTMMPPQPRLSVPAPPGLGASSIKLHLPSLE